MIEMPYMIIYNNIVDALKEYGMWDELNFNSEKTRKSYKMYLICWKVMILLEENW